jgi:hypothetical protein
MDQGRTWELPFNDPAELELHTDFGSVWLVPVEPGGQSRLELHRNCVDRMAVEIDKHEDRVRVRLEPQPDFAWFRNWDCRATLYVPRNVRASLQTNAGSINVRDLVGCELGIKANAGKIELSDTYGLLHLGADAGSIVGRNIGGFLDVETQAGSIRLEVADLQPGEHRVRASMGSVRLELPKGMDVCIETRTSLGSVRNNYPSSQSAPVKLFLATEMGSLRVDEGSYPAPSWPRRPDAPPSPPVPAAPTSPREADPELERILKMVESGELSAQEADELLQAMGRT